MTQDQLLISASIIVPILAALIVYAMRKWVQDVVTAQNTVQIGEDKVSVSSIILKIHSTLSENNGGSSVKDSLDGIKVDLSNLSGKFDQHIVEHGKTPAPTRLLRVKS